MTTDVTTILNILDTHIRKCQEDMDEVVNYEIDRADWDCPIPSYEAENLEKRWTDCFIMKNMLTRIRDEIIQAMLQ